MSPIVQELTLLPTEEKMHIVQELWDSIAADEAKISVSEEDKAEIRRRIELYRRGELKTESWPEMRARIVANRS
jgi:putative addiction module component (TIGR02574 family)